MKTTRLISVHFAGTLAHILRDIASTPGGRARVVIIIDGFPSESVDLAPGESLVVSNEKPV